MPFKYYGPIEIPGYTDRTPCKHPEHNPPTMTALKEGVYKYSCPYCDAIQTVVVGPKPTL
jgi:hypothetical protein